MEVQNIKDITRAYNREKRAREILEKDINAKARALYLSQQYFTNLFDSMKNGMAIFSKDGNLTNCNTFFKDFFAKEIIEDSPAFIILFRETNTKGRGQPSFSKFKMNKEYELVLLNDEEVPVSCRFTEVTNPQTNTIEIAVAVTDLTITKNTAREKTELQNQLIEGAYRDGVAENAVAILHNIGNVLTAIIGRVDSNITLRGLVDLINDLTEIDLKEASPEELLQAIKEELRDAKDGFAKDFQFIKDKSNHIAEVIAAQQRYANLKQEIKSTIVVRNLIDDCLLMHEDKILKEHIQITRFDGLQEIFIEKNGMAQTISNVIVNSCESIQERVLSDGINDGKISIHCEQREKEVILEVIDNGIGVPEDVLKKIFEYGYSTKERESGFGLHNCANFLKRSGGSISIINNKEGGATARLSLPTPKGDK